MTTSFQVILSSESIQSVWGEKNYLSYNETGAIIHREELADTQG